MPALRKHAGRAFVIGVPYLWLIVLFLIPFIIVFKISFSETRLAMPPYAPLIEWRDGVPAGLKLYLANYRFVFTDRLYISAYLYSLKVAAVATLWCLLIGYPMAYAIARSTTTWRAKAQAMSQTATSPASNPCAVSRESTARWASRGNPERTT